MAAQLTLATTNSNTLRPDPFEWQWRRLCLLICGLTFWIRILFYYYTTYLRRVRISRHLLWYVLCVGIGGLERNEYRTYDTKLMQLHNYIIYVPCSFV